MPLRSADFASATDRAQCRAIIREGSKNFAAASLLLPPRVREAAYALYAFCRLSDDIVDVQGGSLDAIAKLRTRLELAYAGAPLDSAIDRTFADVVARFAIPHALPEALIDGLEWDVRGVACENLEDVYAYGARVASAVGAMMSALMGVRQPAAVARACDLGVAMQLTNIARDVGEDARNGRLYLPQSWLRAEGVDPQAWLRAPVFTPQIGAVVKRLLAAADLLYARADAGIAALPLDCRPGIFAARHIYREIGMVVARNGFDSVSQRARVPGARKLRLMSRALADAALSSVACSSAALPETQYIVDALAFSRAPHRAGGLTARVLWVAELFASLDTRGRSVRA